VFLSVYTTKLINLNLDQRNSFGSLYYLEYQANSGLLTFISNSNQSTTQIHYEQAQNRLTIITPSGRSSIYHFDKLN
jgi:hypothetical protein